MIDPEPGISRGAGIAVPPSRILERKPGQAILILSALTDTPTKVEALELGAEDYLAKPFSLAELLARVRARLRMRRRGKAENRGLPWGWTTST